MNILELAKQAGFTSEHGIIFAAGRRDIERFAALVREQEIERIKKMNGPELAAINEYIARIEKDAARYQYLRDNPDVQIDYTGRRTLDEHIDAQMAEATHKETWQ